MHRYRAYGLSLSAEFSFPELTPFCSRVEVREHAHEPDVEVREAAHEPDVEVREAAHEPDVDVEIRLGTAQAWEKDVEGRGAAREQTTDTESWAEWLSPGVIRSQFEGVGRFTVSQGRDVLVEPHLGGDPDLLRHMLLGPVLAQVLWQRGKFALHACALRVGSRQLAFVGVSGEGKSTLAIALHRAGHALLCDDTAVLDWNLSPVLVQPAFPRIRANVDTLERLSEARADLRRVHSQLSKWHVPARNFASGPLPLDRVYVLGSGDDFGSEELSRGEAMMELLRHSYYAEQFSGLFGVAHHMKIAGALARAVPVHRLRRPKDWSRIGELVRFVEKCAES